jgi:hypothetical protein
MVSLRSGNRLLSETEESFALTAPSEGGEDADGEAATSSFFPQAEPTRRALSVAGNVGPLAP